MCAIPWAKHKARSLKAIAISVDKTLVSSLYFTCRNPHTSLKGIDDPVIRTQLYRFLVECCWWRRVDHASRCSLFFLFEGIGRSPTKSGCFIDRVDPNLSFSA